MSGNKGIMSKIETSAVLTVLGIITFFSTAIAVTLIAPNYVDPSWTQNSSAYQKQMYEVADPHVYISTSATGGDDLQLVYHIREGYTLASFMESETLKIVAPADLQKYITGRGESKLKLTSDLLLLRMPEGAMKESADAVQKREQERWEQDHPNWKQEGLQKPRFEVLELFRPGKKEAFSLTDTDGVTENWVDDNYVILDESVRQSYHQDPGVLYVSNPVEYRISYYRFGSREGYKYDPRGEAIAGVEKLKADPLSFKSRKELIVAGENLFKAEGCWYCHTDQSRTLVQDCVLNGAPGYPAPPSSANEYVYQKVTFAGTRRIGPDLSRVGVKRDSRDWHKSHFWAPKTASVGTIMPAFRHFFDDDPRGTPGRETGVPNHRFEAVFQYLMTKGTRITPPTQAWWQGKDPIGTLDIIEGRRRAQREGGAR